MDCIDIFFSFSLAFNLIQFYYHPPNLEYLIRSTSYAQHPYLNDNWYQKNIDRQNVSKREQDCTQFYDDYLPLKFSYLMRNDICKCVQQSCYASRVSVEIRLFEQSYVIPCVNNLLLSNSAATQYRLIKIYRVHGNSTNCLSSGPAFFEAEKGLADDRPWVPVLYSHAYLSNLYACTRVTRCINVNYKLRFNITSTPVPRSNTRGKESIVISEYSIEDWTSPFLIEYCARGIIFFSLSLSLQKKVVEKKIRKRSFPGEKMVMGKKWKRGKGREKVKLFAEITGIPGMGRIRGQLA